MHTSPVAATPLPLESMAGQPASPDPGLIDQSQAQPSEPGAGLPLSLGRRLWGGTLVVVGYLLSPSAGGMTWPLTYPWPWPLAT
ncbi:MAG: hypothetical protein LVS60_09765 [Nodosilinea sp. LVE1205-7]